MRHYVRVHTHTLTVVLGDALVVAMLPPLPPSVPSLAMSNAGLDFASDIASSRYCCWLSSCRCRCRCSDE